MKIKSAICSLLLSIGIVGSAFANGSHTFTNAWPYLAFNNNTKSDIQVMITSGNKCFVSADLLGVSHPLYNMTIGSGFILKSGSQGPYIELNIKEADSCHNIGTQFTVSFTPIAFGHSIFGDSFATATMTFFPEYNDQQSSGMTSSPAKGNLSVRNMGNTHFKLGAYSVTPYNFLIPIDQTGTLNPNRNDPNSGQPWSNPNCPQCQ